MFNLIMSTKSDSMICDGLVFKLYSGRVVMLNEYQVWETISWI